jgi:hypothetical protein
VDRLSINFVLMNRAVGKHFLQQDENRYPTEYGLEILQVRQLIRISPLCPNKPLPSRSREN